MAELELITGRTGEQHVLAIDDAEIYRTLLGNGDFILSTGHKFEARMNGANKVDIYDGTAVIQGRQMKIRSGYQEVETDGGVTGFRREDAIVLEYSKSGDIETAELKVVKGANNASSYNPPALQQGNIDEGQVRQVRLWGVRYNGINFERLIDYRTILNTTPIQTALDMATSGLANIQQIITAYRNQIDGDMSSYQSQIDEDMAAYQSQIESRLELIRGAVNVAPLTVLETADVAPQNFTNLQVVTPPSKEIVMTGECVVGTPITVGVNVSSQQKIELTFTCGREETIIVSSDAVLVYNGKKSFHIYSSDDAAIERIASIRYISSSHLEVPKAGYEFNIGDVFVLYLNGLRARPSKYYVEDNDSVLNVYSTEGLFGAYDEVLLEIWRPEEA